MEGIVPEQLVCPDSSMVVRNEIRNLSTTRQDLENTNVVPEGRCDQRRLNGRLQIQF